MSRRARDIRRPRGAALLVVLVLLAVIGLSSASALRSAFSGGQLARSLRMQQVAEQATAALLGACEAELAKTEDARTFPAGCVVTSQTLPGAEGLSVYLLTATSPGQGAAVRLSSFVLLAPHADGWRISDRIWRRHAQATEP